MAVAAAPRRTNPPSSTRCVRAATHRPATGRCVVSITNEWTTCIISLILPVPFLDEELRVLLLVALTRALSAVAAGGARLGIAAPLETHGADLVHHSSEAVVATRKAPWVDLQEASGVACDVAGGDWLAGGAVGVADPSERHVVVASVEKALIFHELGGFEEE